MSNPVVRHKGNGGENQMKHTSGSTVVLLSSDQCGQCGSKVHLISDHVVEKANQCNKCSCVAQDTENA